jgi:hypothetical protein
MKAQAGGVCAQARDGPAWLTDGRLESRSTFCVGPPEAGGVCSLLCMAAMSLSMLGSRSAQFPRRIGMSP